MNRGPYLLSGALALAVSANAWAAPSRDKLQCVESYEQGQRDRQAGELLSAKKHFSHCASDACPTAMHNDCRGWKRELDQELPSLVLDITSRHGALQGLEVQLDGTALHDPASGRAIQTEAGVHTLRVRAPGYKPVELSFTAHEREQNRRIAVELAPVESEPAQPPSSASRLSPAVLIFGSLSLVGAGAFGYFGTTARRDDRALDNCSPNCERSTTNRIQRDYLIANISAGVGAAAAITAVVFWFAGAPESEAPVAVTWSPGRTWATYQTRF